MSCKFDKMNAFTDYKQCCVGLHGKTLFDVRMIDMA